MILTEKLNASKVKNWNSLNHITLIVELEAFCKLSFTTEVGASFIRHEDKDSHHKLKRWDTNDAWCSQWRKPKNVN